MRLLLLPFSLLLLAGCNESSSYSFHGSRSAAPPPVAMESDMAYSKVASEPAPTASNNPTSQSYLAYRYNYGFDLPARSVAATAKSHAEICQDAGPGKCQLLSSSTNDSNNDYVSANLSLRAEPAWLETFIGQIQTSVSEQDGRMTSNSVSAEDLTRSILDTDARLKAQTTLRDRLQGLLATRDAELPDLLALERELARVQSEIESATTTLAVLRQRVTMSQVNINYQSQSVAVSRSAFAPIAAALKSFFGELSQGLAGVISFFAFILPWLLFVILPGLFLLRWIWRRRKKKSI